MKNSALVGKILSLLVALTAVLFLMRSLRQQGLGDDTKTALGLQTPSEELTWCETRVSGLKSKTQRIAQRGIKWYREAPQEAELDSVAVEKWFGEHCSLPIQVVSNDRINMGAGQMEPILEVDFIRGPSSEFLQESSGAIIWRDKAFTSPELQRAIGDLDKLPESTSPSTQ